MQKSFNYRRKMMLGLVGLVATAVMLMMSQPTAAQSGTPLHPTYVLLDEAGENVLTSGEPVSPRTTCGQCHDTEFIAGHSFHADVGLSAMTVAGETASGRPWDTSDGLFGKWNPLTYRVLSPAGDEQMDLTTAAWLMLNGGRFVGGGPGQVSRSGDLLTELPPTNITIETGILNPETGELAAWDWVESGTLEMDCFLCHLPEPNHEARTAVIAAGDFRWASTATLSGMGLVEQVGDDWVWQAAAFAEDGRLRPEFNTVQDPTNGNCGLCHGVVQDDLTRPLTLDMITLDNWRTATTGQIISPDRISDSGLNIAGKADLARSWDVHTERVINCTECHYSLNNPVYYQEADASQPEHLLFDPRRIDLGEYLVRPLHQFAKGQSAQGTVAPELDNTLRRCESCHSIETTHNWLPYKERHTEAVACESCHIPEILSPALASVDWTVLLPENEPVLGYRGIDGEFGNQSLITGYEPTLLPRENGDGSKSLAPFNLVTAWFWVAGEPERPVRLLDLERAWFDADGYHPDVLAAFDGDGDGRLTETELHIDTEAKEKVIADRLAAMGLTNPRIVGEIQPYSINHNVTTEAYATQDCRVCHGEASRITQPMVLGGRQPGGVTPTFVNDSGTSLTGEISVGDDGRLLYTLQPQPEGLYIFGHSAVDWIDWAGMLLFLGTLVGVTAHGGMRYFAARKRPSHQPELRREYMYGVYERLWHWLQTILILLLIFTGLVIHKPDKFGIFSFNYVVQVHNVLAAILVINAALAAFYHFASGEIRQFLPQPRGFFSQAIVQAQFYLNGIFNGAEHPFEKTREKKMNPLQQATYFGLLNVLLPLQIISGALMWGVQRWPEIAASLGGLPFLAPAHTLIAWLFATFVVGHVYLTTTGHKPLAAIQGMMLGWDEVEVAHAPSGD